MNLSTMLRYGRKILEEASITDASVDAMELLQFVCGIDRNYYYMHMDEEISSENQMKYEALVEKRASHIPIQQITGRAYFMGLEFYVNEHVLIPRFDTEVLVEETLKCIDAYLKTHVNEIGDAEKNTIRECKTTVNEKNKCKNKGNVKVLDMCTGSGCIILSIKDMKPDVEATGVDISEEALAVAKKNSKSLNLPVEFIQSDLFSYIQGKYAIIVSNPPYIPTAVIETLDAEVKDHEPLMALDGTADGLYFYRKISKQALEYLEDGGYLCFEIGHDQGPAVSEFMKELGYTDVKVVKDLSGFDRVVLGGKPCLTN